MSLEFDACARESLWNFPEVNELGKPPEYIFLVLYGIGFNYLFGFVKLVWLTAVSLYLLGNRCRT